eukprot:1020202-Alexandrium_andersonii.AAC.1
MPLLRGRPSPHSTHLLIGRAELLSTRGLQCCERLLPPSLLMDRCECVAQCHPALYASIIAP